MGFGEMVLSGKPPLVSCSLFFCSSESHLNADFFLLFLFFFTIPSGMLLRQPLLRPGITSEFLPIGILFSLIHDLVNLWIPTEDQDRSQTSNVEIPEMDQGKAEEVVRIYNQFWNYVQENRLVERAEEKGRLDVSISEEPINHTHTLSLTISL